MSDSSATKDPASQADVTAGELMFVVMGSTGEYSDRSEWAVMAYLDEQAAKDHADKAKTRWLELCAGRDYWKTSYSQLQKLAALNEYDPGHGCDYTGVDWYVMEVPLCRSPAKPSQP